MTSQCDVFLCKRKEDYMKIKIKKLLGLFSILIISLFSTPVIANAQTFNDQLYIDKNVAFWMATTQFDDPNDWAGVKEYGIRRTSDNQLIYCIQAHVEVKDGALIVGYDNENDKISLANLTRDQLKQIELISYYGYGYTGHTDTDWYAATQFLIWQVTDPTNTPYPIEPNDQTLARSSRYDSKMNEIIELVNNHGNTISFNNQTVTMKVGETIRLTDTNNVLNKYFEVESNDNIDMRIDGNDLVITAKTGFEGNINLNVKENTNPPLIYDGANQKCLSRGDPTFISGKIALNVETEFKAHKVFGSNASGTYTPEEGAIFELYDNDTNTLIATLKSDSNGEISIYLGFGNYRLHQTDGKEGYQFIDDYFFTIDGSNPKIEIYLNNEKIKSDLEFTKTDFVTGKPLANAFIEIYNADTEELVFSGTSDNNGKIIIKNIEYGNYYIIEKTAPDGYILSTEKIPFSVTKNGEIIKITMSNEQVVEVPNTGIADSKILEVVGIVLVIAGIGYIAYDKFKKKK